MEAFEQIVKVFLESKGYIVTCDVKFPVKIKTQKTKYDEYQTHGYEIDIVASKSGSLLLGSVKSFFGSGGVERQGFKGIADDNKATHYNSYRIFNDPEVRNGIIKEAQNRYGYSPDQMGICLFVGKFRKGQEKIITEHLSKQNFIVYNLRIITEGLLKAAQPKTYLNDPVIVTIKALDLAGLLRTSID